MRTSMKSVAGRSMLSTFPMQRFLKVAAAAVVVAELSLGAQTPRSSVSGRVVAAGTGRPIAGAQISMNEADAVLSATSEAEGRFEFRGTFSARYRLSASAAGYLRRTYNDEPLLGHTPVAVPAGGAVTDLLIELHRGGTISGRVVDRAGEPVVAGAVRAFRRSGAKDGALASAAARAMGVAFGNDPRTETDDRGQFRLIGVEPGEYVVGAVDRTIVTFAPASATLAGATAVTVGVDEERAGVNIRVERTPSGAIEGVITRAGVSASAPVTVELTADPNDARITPLRVTAGGDNRFAFADVPAGPHVLIVRPAPMSPAAAPWGRAQIAVPPNGTAQATLTLHEGSRLAGRIQPRPGASRVVLAPVDPGATGPRPQARVDPDGAFAFVGLAPGRYYWERSQGVVGSYGPRSLLSAIVNGEDVTDAPFEIAARTSIENVRLELTEGSVIAGTVRDPAGSITTAGAVVIAPVDRRHATEVSRRLRVVRADNTGYFEARSLPPGRYRVAHVTRLATAHPWDAAFLDALSGAQEVALGAAQNLTLALRSR